MCQLLEVPRSLVYRTPADRSPRKKFFEELTARILEIASMHPGYGYRRVRRELGKRGAQAGYKAVAKAMREAGLRPKRKQPYPRTSDGRGKGNYPNLLKEATAQGPGEIWVADITYVALPAGGFAYLACILDVFLRKVVGSAFGRKIDSALTLLALERALGKWPPKPGWIHHSDLGSQYLSDAHVKRVLGSGGLISCSDKGCPEDNAFIESFFKTLKSEEVWLEDYESFEHADQSVARFIDYYNSERMHSSLGYQTPQEFERSPQENDPL
jgi:transposase InsO family protein